ncbi:MAG: hypothetical protein PHT63_02260 [Bacteroidales bacterium]|nr:hypothetical protein [Bacteroidales bacterium]
MKKILIFITLLLTYSAVSATAKRGFAVVIDPEAYQICRSSVDRYLASVNNQGLKYFLIVDRWSNPDSIRQELRRLYIDNNLEGAVFIGDIPVPMIRNGQHLTTAFKMDQRRPWEYSSVPSDRFYDDFDLKFEYLKKDSVHVLYHYYNLADDSPHRIECDIYSARIKPPVVEGKTRFQLIEEYLNKAVREKQNRRKINSLTYFAGHGYNSGCMVSRADERLALTEQFPRMRSGRADLNYIDHSFDDFIKFRLMAELGREELDLAVLHHHGSEDAQLLSATPKYSMASDWIEQVKKFVRGKIRGAKDSAESKKYYLENYDIPEHWVENTFDPEIIKKDSLFDANLDITLPDMKDYVPNAGFVILDACFTGSFHLDDYISGHYIFAPGRTVAVRANSVNTIQDVWTIELLGLLDLGVSVGNWAKGQMTLESHLLGDPTYRYICSDTSLEGLDEALSLKKSDKGYWKRLLRNNNPEVSSLAMKMLFKLNLLSTDELLSVLNNDMRPTVRLQAFNLINKKYDHNLIPAIKLGMDDSYELIRRMSVIKAAGNLSPELLEQMVTNYISPQVSQRVAFQLKEGIVNYNKEDLLAAFDRVTTGKDYHWYRDKISERKNLEYVLGRSEREFEELNNETIPARNKRFTITALRNSNNTAYMEKLYKFLRESPDNDLRVLLAEAFAWYTNSHKRDEIINFCRELADKERDENVKKELIRTINRLLY